MHKEYEIHKWGCRREANEVNNWLWVNNWGHKWVNECWNVWYDMCEFANLWSSQAERAVNNATHILNGCCSF